MAIEPVTAMRIGGGLPSEGRRATREDYRPVSVPLRSPWCLPWPHDRTGRAPGAAPVAVDARGPAGRWTAWSRTRTRSPRRWRRSSHAAAHRPHPGAGAAPGRGPGVVRRLTPGSGPRRGSTARAEPAACRPDVPPDMSPSTAPRRARAWWQPPCWCVVDPRRGPGAVGRPSAPTVGADDSRQRPATAARAATGAAVGRPAHRRRVVRRRRRHAPTAGDSDASTPEPTTR